jgi:hypothetical protein
VIDDQLANQAVFYLMALPLMAATIGVGRRGHRPPGPRPVGIRTVAPAPHGARSRPGTDYGSARHATAIPPGARRPPDTRSPAERQLIGGKNLGGGRVLQAHAERMSGWVGVDP